MRVLLVLLLFMPISLCAAELPPFAQKAERLFEIGDYDNALGLYEECYQDAQNPVCISQPINLLESEFVSLPTLTRKSITVFKTEKKNISATDFLKKEIYERVRNFSLTDTILDALAPALGGLGGIGKGVDMDQYSRLYHFIAGETSAGSPIAISTPDDMERITSRLPFFKTWLQKLTGMARNCYARDDQEVCLEYMKKLTALKQNLDGYYRNFFSYDIASPILAKTQQLIFIADDSKLIGVDECIMRDAAKILGTLNDDMIRYVNQDVRNQFLDVVKEFREKAGKEFTEELKAIQTLQDKFVNNRYTEPLF